MDIDEANRSVIAKVVASQPVIKDVVPAKSVIKELNEGKVSYPQFFLLTYLASEDFLSRSSIAQKMGHSTAAATGMVDKLQEMGYLKRMSAAKDRRKIMVAITQEGRDLVARMRQNIVRDLAALMAGADPDARQTLADTGKSIRKRRLA